MVSLYIISSIELFISNLRMPLTTCRLFNKVRYSEYVDTIYFPVKMLLQRIKMHVKRQSVNFTAPMFLFHQLQTPSCKDFLSFSTNTKIACSLGWVHFINYFIVYCSFNKLTVHCVCKFMVNCPALLSLLITIHFPTNALPSCGVGLQFHSVNPSFAYWIIVWLWRPLLKCRQGLSSVVELPVRWHCLLLSSGPSSNSCESIIADTPSTAVYQGKKQTGLVLPWLEHLQACILFDQDRKVSERARPQNEDHEFAYRIRLRKYITFARSELVEPVRRSIDWYIFLLQKMEDRSGLFYSAGCRIFSSGNERKFVS